MDTLGRRQRTDAVLHLAESAAGRVNPPCPLTSMAPLQAQLPVQAPL